MIGTGFAYVTTTLSNFMIGATPPQKLAYAASAVALFVYACGFLLSFKLPEPQSAALPE